MNMTPGLKIGLGAGAAVLALLLLTSGESKAQPPAVPPMPPLPPRPPPMPAMPPLPQPPMPVPVPVPVPTPGIVPILASANLVSRTDLPPPNATVVPNPFDAKVLGLELMHADPTATFQIPEGTLGARIRLTDSRVPGSFFDSTMPVSWVSPDANRYAFTFTGAPLDFQGKPTIDLLFGSLNIAHN